MPPPPSSGSAPRRLPGPRRAARGRAGQGVEAALGPSARLLAQGEREAALAPGTRIVADGGGEAALPAPVRLVGEQGATGKVEREAEPGHLPGHATAQLDPDAAPGIPAVVAHPRLHSRRDAATGLQRHRPTPLQPQPEPRHLGLRPRQARARPHRLDPRRVRLRPQRIGDERKRQSGRPPWRQQLAPQPRRDHAPVEVGLRRRPTLGGERHRARSVARRSPQPEPLRRLRSDA